MRIHLAAAIGVLLVAVATPAATACYAQPQTAALRA